MISFGWERVNTGTIYFIDDSTSITENLEPAKKISINGQQNFAAGEEAKWKAAPATNVVVENGVSIKSEVYNYFKKTYVGGTIHIDTQVIPEPATCAALFGGLALTFALARRRK